MGDIVKQDIEPCLDCIRDNMMLVDVLTKKQTDTPHFIEYRRRYYLKLRDTIPKRMGMDNERFRKHKKVKSNEAKRLLKEFDAYFSFRTC